MRSIDYIDTSIGTVGDEQETSFHGGGKTHPGACTPFGMVQLSPDTVTGGDNGTGYNYCNTTIEGFSINHMSGIGWYGDLGNLQIMPITGKVDLRSGTNEEVPFKKGTLGWRSEFSHENEKTKAGYYSVYLDRYKILAEATALAHTGVLRLAYDEKDAGIIFNFSRRIAGKSDFQKIKITSEKSLEGYIKCTSKFGGFGRGHGNISYDLYFAIELSQPMKKYTFFENEEYLSNRDYCEGEDVGLLVELGDTSESVEISIAISYTDLDGAKNNLKNEKCSFNIAREKAENAWLEALSCVEVTGDNETDKILFNTCLYHTLLDPRTMLDSDGRYKNASGEIKSPKYNHRTMFSGWDVYRSEFPLLTIISPDTVNDEICSLLEIAKERNSSLPRWELMGIDSGCMVGDPALIVLADAYLKGIRDFDIDSAYEIILASSKVRDTLNDKKFLSARPKNKQYKENAYVVGDLSSTLEYLLADYTASRLANALNKSEDERYFNERASTYKDNFNKALGFMAPRDENGEFLEINDKYDTRGCVESNIFQQSFFVPYDIENLARLFGKERFESLLSELFEKADLTSLWNENYNHSNEPCHNLTHYFNYLGSPRKTQYWTRRVQKEAYRLGAFGFCGNEDVGQLSAWYVLSSLGFAQLCPADNKLSINTPLFKESKIKLNQKYHACKISSTFEIKCDKSPNEYPYISKIILNGEELNRYYLTYEEITNGGKLELVLSK